MAAPGEFYEEDEPIANILAAWDNGEEVETWQPGDPVYSQTPKGSICTDCFCRWTETALRCPECHSEKMTYYY